jgi:hypothetical protein
LGDCKRAKGNGIAILSAAAALVLALGTLAAAGAATHLETVTFRAEDLVFGEDAGRDLVSLGGDRWLARPGEPRLPAEPYRVALPPGSRVVSVNVTPERSQALEGRFDIAIARAPQPISGAAAGASVPAGASAYLESDFYPSSHGEYLGAGYMDGVLIADIMLYPLRYNSADGSLVLATDLRVEVEYARDGSGAGETRVDARMIEGLVSSSAVHRPGYEKKVLDLPYAALGGEVVEYLIIADSSLASSFQPLLDWKRRKGVPGALVTLDEIDGAYAGADLQERIRNCIDDYHNNHGTTWVLLGGDTGFIPERRLYVALSDKTSIPSDLYYADLDGNWNEDADLRWGEVPADAVDMYADVYLGRAPVASAPEAQVFVDKVLTYEGVYGPPGDRQENMLFLAEILWGDLSDPSDPEFTDGGIAKDIIEASYVPGGFAVLKLYESLYNLSQAAAEAALNEGQGMINVNCHGAVNGISLGEEGLPLSSVLGLTNGPAYGIMYSTSCMVGAYDQTSIGEAWVLSPAGGGFFIGNSRYGWGTPGAPGLGPSDHYDQSFFETVFLTGLENLGKAHAYAKHEYVAESRYDDYYRYVMYGLNLFGDPETPIWTARPAALHAEFPPAAPCCPYEFPVTVTSGGTPVAGATVCLYKQDDVYLVGQTGALGSINFYLEPAELGTLYVTVTGENYVPCLGTSMVEDSDTGVPGGRGGHALTLSVEPNPFRSTVSLAVTGAPAERVEIGVFDIRGRRVAGFETTTGESGVAALTWDGRDVRGHKVSPGIYVVMVRAGETAIMRKALLVR